MSHNIEDVQFWDGNVSIQYAKVSMLIEYFKAAMCSALPQTAHRSILNDGTACEEKSSMVQLYAMNPARPQIELVSPSERY